MNFSDQQIFQQAELAPNLEWMLQSSQATEDQIVAICVRDHFRGLFAVARLLTGDSKAAFNAVIQTISQAVHLRQRYSSTISPRAWLFHFLFRKFGVQFWEFSKIRTSKIHYLLMENLGFNQVEAVYVTSRFLSPNRKVMGNFARPAVQSTFDDVQQFKFYLIEADQFSPAQIEAVQDIILRELRAKKRQFVFLNSFQQAMLALAVLVCVLGLLGLWSASDNSRPTPTPQVRIVKVTTTPLPTLNVAAFPTVTSSPLATPASMFVDLGNLVLPGFEQVNNSRYDGTNSLGIVLNYWGMHVSATDLRNTLMPENDQTIQLSELESFALERGMAADLRMGGDAAVLRRLVKAGFPVIVEIGDGNGSQWKGRFQVIKGYNFYAQNFFTTWPEPSQGLQNFIQFDELVYRWQYLNNPFLVIFDPQKMNIDSLYTALEEFSTPSTSYLLARYNAVYNNSYPGGEFFSKFNFATSLFYLNDFHGAALAYDQAFQIMEKMPADERPANILLYQIQPYRAYYFDSQYQRLVDLASQTILQAGDKAPDDSYFWRGMGYQALGQYDQAVADFQEALKCNPHYFEAQFQLDRFYGR